jgi:hypothetical protein
MCRARPDYSVDRSAKATQETLLPRTHLVSTNQMVLYEESVLLTILVHLEIESFYVFGKILLDKVARSLHGLILISRRFLCFLFRMFDQNDIGI